MGRRVCALILACLGCAGLAWSQTQIAGGVIQGTVIDPTGALLPGVTVEIRHLDTNLTTTRTTDDDGRFVALALPPGGYTVTMRLQGFKTVVQENVVLTVGQSANLNTRLEVSTIAETVTVSARPTVETTRSAVANTLDSRTVENTPILGRKFEDLLTLTPGGSASATNRPSSSVVRVRVRLVST